MPSSPGHGEPCRRERWQASALDTLFSSQGATRRWIPGQTLERPTWVRPASIAVTSWRQPRDASPQAAEPPPSYLQHTAFQLLGSTLRTVQPARRPGKSPCSISRRASAVRPRSAQLDQEPGARSRRPDRAVRDGHLREICRHSPWCTAPNRPPPPCPRQDRGTDDHVARQAAWRRWRAPIRRRGPRPTSATSSGPIGSVRRRYLGINPSGIRTASRTSRPVAR